MSYWYTRFKKKHVFIAVASFMVLIPCGVGQVGASYAIGCIATASRTLYDWISVERPINQVEVVPYVAAILDTGCVEWLGFSTCETVQFGDWMPIWMRSETDTLTIFNVTQTGATFSTAALSPMVLDKTYVDQGTAVGMGSVSMKKRVTVGYSADMGVLVNTFNPGYAGGDVANAFASFKLGDLLGGMWMDITLPRTEAWSAIVPSPVNKDLGPKTLYHFTSTQADGARCSFDDDCATTCVLSGACEPLTYGSQGTLMPSATFFYAWKAAFELGHWPVIAWNYKLFCPVSTYDPQCINEKSFPVTVFFPDSMGRVVLYNEGEASGGGEKYPDLALQHWKGNQLVRRTEGCDGRSFIGAQGKDCGVPSEYTYVGPSMYVSFPAGESINIYSEIITGLNFEYTHVWQMNKRFSYGGTDTFLPCYKLTRQPTVLKLKENLDTGFAALKDYGGSMSSFIGIGLFIYLATYFLWIYLFLASVTCVEYMRAVNGDYAPFRPEYL